MISKQFKRCSSWIHFIYPKSCQWHRFMFISIILYHRWAGWCRKPKDAICLTMRSRSCSILNQKFCHFQSDIHALSSFFQLTSKTCSKNQNIFYSNKANAISQKENSSRIVKLTWQSNEFFSTLNLEYTLSIL